VGDSLKKKFYTKRKNGQSALEFLLLLGVVVSLFFAFFDPAIKRINKATNTYFNLVSNQIMGPRVDKAFLDSNID